MFSTRNKDKVTPVFIPMKYTRKMIRVAFEKNGTEKETFQSQDPDESPLYKSYFPCLNVRYWLPIK